MDRRKMLSRLNSNEFIFEIEQGWKVSSMSNFKLVEEGNKIKLRSI